MATFPSPLAQDDPTIPDGDAGFLALNARNNPELLDPGELQVSENLRLDRGVAIVRNGARSRGELITGTGVLTLDFTLGADINLVGITRTGGQATVETATAHGLTVGRVVNLRDTGRAAYDLDFFVTGIVSATKFTITVVGAPANVTGAGIMNAGPVLGTGPITDPVRAAGRYINALAAGKPEFIIIIAGPRSYHYQEGIPAVPIVEFPAGETVDEGDDIALVPAADRMMLLRKPEESGEFAPFTIDSITRTGTTAEATATGHWLQVGNRVRLTVDSPETFNHEFDVTGRGTNTFTFEIVGDPIAPVGVIRAQRVKPPMYWDGTTTRWVKTPGGNHPAGPTYSRMPGNCVVAAYYNGQFVIAFGKDELWVSDVEDPDTYDEFSKSFRAGSGGSDYIVAVHPYADRDLLVLCRYSLSRAHIELDDTGTSIDPATSYCIELTSEIGCRARNSTATVRQYVYFLSDSGVYRIDQNFTSQRLQELSLLLSDPVRPITESFEWTVADAASGVFHDSRYWLLVQRNDQSAPNMLLIYSMLNEKWETVDLFDSLDGVALVTARYNNRERLFCAGGGNVLTLMNDRTDGDDSGDDVLPIIGRARGRRLVHGDSTSVKRFLRCKAPARLPVGGEYLARAIIQHPAQTMTIGTETAGASVLDVVTKYPIRAPGHSIEIEVELTGPGATLQGITIEAAGTSEPPESRTRSQG